MDDPARLMQGKGKVHRRVNLQLVEQVQSPDLKNLMHRALEAAQNPIQ